MGCESALGLGNGNENAQIECECSIWFMWMLKLIYVNAQIWFIYLSLWFNAKYLIFPTMIRLRFWVRVLGLGFGIRVWG